MAVSPGFRRTLNAELLVEGLMWPFNANWAPRLRYFRENTFFNSSLLLLSIRGSNSAQAGRPLLFLSPPSAMQNLLSATTNALVYHRLQINTRLENRNVGDRDRDSGPRVQPPLRSYKELLARTNILLWHV